MPGRGEADEYIAKAAKAAKDAVEEKFHDSPDEVQAAVVAGVFSLFAQNVIPSYILETEEY
jgi:hypothetical protein